MRRITLLCVASATLFFTGCNVSSNANQSKICIWQTDEEAKKCKNGELSYFSPDRWGNEKLPLNVIASYCDTNHQVIMNNSGVICTFTNERLHYLETNYGNNKE